MCQAEFADTAEACSRRSPPEAVTAAPFRCPSSEAPESDTTRPTSRLARDSRCDPDRWSPGGCGREAIRPTLADRLVLPPLRADTDRISAVTVCTRPFRAEGRRLECRAGCRKTIVHNYGHGGSGWSLSCGSSSIAMGRALATGGRDIAVIGCGALGLTPGVRLQRVGALRTVRRQGSGASRGRKGW